jgi:methionine synthase II (cobalamin-independent)
LSDEELDAALDKAISFAIGLQESAGADIISDGEWRRIGYFEVFAQTDTIVASPPGKSQEQSEGPADRD